MQRERVEALRPDVRRWCAELARSAPGASLDHHDLHPGNVLAGFAALAPGEDMLATLGTARRVATVARALV